MNNTTESNSSWVYADSPWDTFFYCELLQKGDPSSLVLCATSVLVGFSSLFFIPIICTFGMLSNSITAWLFLFKFRKLTRQLIYMALLCVADAVAMLLLGWLWYVPAKGIPYITHGQIYYFIIYEHPLACHLHRFAFSFSTTLASNLLLLTSVDRCLCIYTPLKYSRLPVRYAWYLVAFVITASIVCTIPFGVLMHLHESDGLITCSLRSDQIFWQIFGILFNNAGIVQVMLVGILNLLFMRKIKKSFSSERLKDPKSIESKEMAASVILFILAGTCLLFALPQGAAYLSAFLFPLFMTSESSTRAIHLANNIADLSWHCLFTQQACAIFVCIKRMREFRNLIYKLLHCPWTRYFKKTKSQENKSTVSSLSLSSIE